MLKKLINEKEYLKLKIQNFEDHKPLFDIERSRYQNTFNHELLCK